MCAIYLFINYILILHAGRNLALKQQTWQSSSSVDTSNVTTSDNITFSSERAVDGDANRDFYEGNTCTQAVRGSNDLLSWNLTFSHAVLVDRYVLFLPADSRYLYTQDLELYYVRLRSQVTPWVLNVSPFQVPVRLEVCWVGLLSHRLHLMSTTRHLLAHGSPLNLSMYTNKILDSKYILRR